MRSAARGRGLMVLASLAATIVLLTGCAAGPGLGSEPRVIQVPGDADTISAAVETARSGDLVLVEPGTYRETVTIATPGITLRGVDRNTVIIDGEGLRSQGVLVIADGVRIENLTVRSHTFNGILITGMHDGGTATAHGVEGYTPLDIEKFPPIQGFAVDSVTASNNGLYGIYAFDAQHGTITNSYASGSADSGFYVGQCRDCDVLLQGNVAEHNAVGFEFANASDSLLVMGNRASHNRVGLTILSTYQEALSPQRGATIVGNLIVDNNEAVSPAQAEGGFGLGIGLSGGTSNTVQANYVGGHVVAGMLVSNTEDLRALDNTISANVFVDNGVDLADTAQAGAPSAGTCLQGNQIVTVLPAELLTRGCDDAGSVGAAAPGALPAISAPAGMSFLKVPLPPAQPQRAGDPRALPAALPGVVTMPAWADVSAPTRDLLAEGLMP